MRPPFARTLPDLLYELDEDLPSDIAVISGTRVLTFSQLAERARAVATALRTRGVRRGDRVGILCNNRGEWLEICFGASSLGAVVVPFSTWSTRYELEFLLADSQIRMLFALHAFGDRDFAGDLTALLPEMDGDRVRSERFSRLETIVAIGETPTGWIGYERLIQEGSAFERPPPGEGPSAFDDAYVLYTSGSSAKPKAVRLKHYGVIENGFNIGERQGLRAGDLVLLSPPLFWSYGAANALPSAFTHGAALVLQEKFDAELSLDLIERHRCTAIYTLPGMTSAMVRHAKFSRERTRSLRTGVTIGAPQDFLEAARSLAVPELCNVYGATETYGNCCVTWHHWPSERRAECQGPPLPGNVMRFVDPDSGSAVLPGSPGAAEVKGYISPGYSGASAELNDAIFTSDGYYRTGDLGYLNETGDFVFVGRSTEMIKRAGINVSPAEVEEVLLRHAAVAQAGVVGVPDRALGESIVAFVVPASGISVTGAELIAHCRSVASKYKVPDRIELCDALPLTPTGKLQRRDLKRTAADLVASGR